MIKGKFITLEGSEGAGKSTAVQVLQETLDKWGVSYISTREPGGEKNAEKIRDILLNSEHLDSKTELLLMFASRNEHLMKTIRPALDKGSWVISDRFVDASYAYQGGGRNIENTYVQWLDSFIVGDTEPDLTLFLDVEPHTGLQRIAQRSAKDRIEQEKLSFFNRIREAYLLRMKKHPMRIKRIDANEPVARVQSQIKTVLNDFRTRLL